jgi:rubrerythrin
MSDINNNNAWSADIDTILALPSRPADEKLRFVDSNIPACFTWDYSRNGLSLDKLYEKAKRSQWNATTDLPWETVVDMEKEAASTLTERKQGTVDWSGSPVALWGDKEWTEFAMLSQRWSLSQFLHGEQGALLCSARLVEAVPNYEAKLFASTQVVDEARHVEVFARYLNEKLGGGFQINAHLGTLLEDILVDERWDMVYLGMQVMVEGLALAAFGYMQHLSQEPLLKQLLKQVMADEARHVAFGTISLKEVYQELSSKELQDRAEFAFDASLRMRDRFLQQEVWEQMGASPKDVIPRVAHDPQRMLFQSMLFAKIVPNCKKLGLLDVNDGWLRHRFEEINVIGFENMDTTDDEVEQGVFDLTYA